MTDSSIARTAAARLTSRLQVVLVLIAEVKWLEQKNMNLTGFSARYAANRISKPIEDLKITRLGFTPSFLIRN